MQALRDDLARAGADEREATQLAALLERAAEPARFDVTRAEVENALGRVRPVRRPLRVPRIVLGAAALAAAAIALILVLPSRQEPVEARALSALGGPNTVLHLREVVLSDIPGAAATTTRDVWYDAARGRTAWVDIGDDGIASARTLVTRTTFDRFVRSGGVRISGNSCTAIAAGCAQLLDPVARYREILRREHVRAVRTTYNSRPTYRFVLPLQAGIGQVVYVDTQTLLPRSILWRERIGGRVETVSTADVVSVDRVDRADVPSGAFARPREGRVVRVLPAGRLVSVRRIDVATARPAHPYWLGRRGLRAMLERRYANGSVYVARYDDVDIWTYGSAVPPELLASRLQETKTIEINGVLMTYLGLAGRDGVVRDGAPSVAAISRGLTTKEVLFGALGRARPLR